MNKIKILAIFTILISHWGNAQTIPFRLTSYNNIIVKALVNDKDSLDLMFQIAMNDASIAPNRKRSAESINFDKNEISDNNTIKIGKVEKKNVRFFDNEYTGHEADGKVGTGFFAGNILKINYDKNEFTIYKKLPKLKGYTSLPIVIKNDQIFIIGENIIDGKSYKDSFLLQSGYSGGLLYSNDFSKDKPLDQQLHITGEKKLTNSAGQTVITKNGSLAKFKLANYTLENVSAGFFAGELKTQKVSYFGADLLKRFNWIIDLKNNIVYIKPSKYYNVEYFKMN